MKHKNFPLIKYALAILGTEAIKKDEHGCHLLDDAWIEAWNALVKSMKEKNK